MAVLPTGSDEAILRLSDGTVKQRNLLTGTEVWTVPGRAHRPLTRPGSPAPIIDHDLDGHHCAFCSGRYLETPPEKARIVRTSEGEWETLHGLGAEELGDTVAEFRRIPNLSRLFLTTIGTSITAMFLPRPSGAGWRSTLPRPRVTTT